MLTIFMNDTEYYDEEKQEFFNVVDGEITLEHSLVSLSKWESLYQIPFLTSQEKTQEQTLQYVKFMVLTPNFDESFFTTCGPEVINKIQEYMDSSQSATTFGENPKTRVAGEIITSELIYYWLVAFNIPFECQYWHLNRLLSLIRICNAKNGKQQKLSKAEVVQRNRELNAQRKKELGTSG